MTHKILKSDRENRKISPSFRENRRVLFERKSITEIADSKNRSKSLILILIVIFENRALKSVHESKKHTRSKAQPKAKNLSRPSKS